jgi:methyltransferase (TIGR00027 family)
VPRSIDTTTSRTAEMTCFSRAVSSQETSLYYKSDDYIAPLILPAIIKPLIHLALFRRIYNKFLAPPGIYEYIIARTKYIDAVFEKALAYHFDQILIMGSGFDSRALRFGDNAGKTKIFELDVPSTQWSKISQYQKRKLTIPDNLTFIAIDFDKEALPDKFNETGFRKGVRSLFVLEGLTMYLQPESVDMTFKIICEYAGSGSQVVFDYIYASVLRDEGIYYGEKVAKKMVSDAGESWYFGIEKGGIENFLALYDLRLIDHQDALALERTYFSDANGNIIGRINGTHCIVTAEKE